MILRIVLVTVVVTMVAVAFWPNYAARAMCDALFAASATELLARRRA